MSRRGVVAAVLAMGSSLTAAAANNSTIGLEFKTCMAPVLATATWPPANLHDYDSAAPPQIILPSDCMAYGAARQ